MAEVSGTASTSAEPFTSRAPSGAGRQDTRLVQRYPVVVPSGENVARPADVSIIGDLRIHSESQHGAVPVSVSIIEAETLDVIRPIIISQRSRRRELSSTLSSLLP